MIRLTELDGLWYVLTAPVPRMHLPQSKRDGMQCMCSSMRPATAEELDAYRKYGRPIPEAEWREVRAGAEKRAQEWSDAR